MNEVYKAMQALKCVWHQVNNYRVLCLWKYTSGIVPKPQPSPTIKLNVSATVTVPSTFAHDYGQLAGRLTITDSALNCRLPAYISMIVNAI
jgi:hypothetical protein